MSVYGYSILLLLDCQESVKFFTNNKYIIPLITARRMLTKVKRSSFSLRTDKEGIKY